MQVILHVRELSQWPVTLANTKNLLALAPEATIEVVTNGPAVTYFFSLTPEEEQVMEELHQQNVGFSVCRNALKANERKEEDLPSFAHGIPAAIYRLVEAQEQGYAYVKP